MTGPLPRVAILLSTFNGARFLPEQLDSYRRQSEPGWRLFWRDDGSDDGSAAIVEQFARSNPVTRIDAPGRLGAAASYYALLAAVVPLGIPVAFSDQDDVWLPGKLARALEGLAGSGPALYCSRQSLVDDDLRPLGPSLPVHHAPTVAGALIQNIATGCTIALDPVAAALVSTSLKPVGPLHDWWSYLLVTAVGGRIVVDAEPSLLYRQHTANQVGAPATRLRRAIAAMRRGPDLYITMLRANVDALNAQPDRLTPSTRRVLAVMERALSGGLRDRLRAFVLPGLRRQTAAETALFRFWLIRDLSTRTRAARAACAPAAAPPR